MTNPITTTLTRYPVNLHLAELRKRLLIAVIAYLFAIVFCYIFASDIYSFLVKPLADIYKEAGVERRLIFTGLTEAFFSHIRVSLLAGFVLSFPVIAWQIYFFIAPGLFRHEKKVIIPYIFMSPVLFIIGAALAYYYIIPLAWKFFIGFETYSTTVSSLPIVLEARVSEYLSLVISLITAFGISFQLPLILILLTHVGFINADLLSKGRRYAIVLIFLLAAILTPPDVVSQVLLAIPLLLLYEISILICKRIAVLKE